MKINETKQFYEKEINEVRTLLSRMMKGQKIITEAGKSGSVATALQGIELYNHLSQEAFERLELCLFYHEYLAMGKTIVIKRTGKAINMDDKVSQKEIEVSPFHLKSLLALKEVLGDNFMDMVEFR